jgi:hypothetical protein
MSDLFAHLVLISQIFQPISLPNLMWDMAVRHIMVFWLPGFG